MLFDLFVLAYCRVWAGDFHRPVSHVRTDVYIDSFSFHQKISGWLYVGGLWAFADFTLAQETTINYSLALEVRFSEGRSIWREKQCNLSVGDLQSPHCLKPHYKGQWRTCIRFEKQTPLIWSYNFHLQNVRHWLAFKMWCHKILHSTVKIYNDFLHWVLPELKL